MPKLVKQPERKKLTVDNMSDNNLDSKTGDDETKRREVVADPFAVEDCLGSSDNEETVPQTEGNHPAF